MSHVIKLAPGNEGLPPLRCPRCGELNAAKARVCAVCGTALPENDEASNEAEEFVEETEAAPTELEDFGIEVEEPVEAPPQPPPAVTHEEEISEYDDFGNEIKPRGSPLKAFFAGFIIVGLAMVALRPPSPPPEANRALEDEARPTATQKPAPVEATPAPSPTINSNAVEVLPPGVENAAPIANAANPTAPVDTATALSTAAQIGDNAEVRKLLDAKADINAVDGKGWTPLMNAAASGKLETVRLLIERGADVNTLTPDGQTALSLATRGGNAEIVKALKDAGAK
jgi:hypothetical protein